MSWWTNLNNVDSRVSSAEVGVSSSPNGDDFGLEVVSEGLFLSVGFGAIAAGADCL